jgi:thiopeptide-type bacteriocin biosynthesis protein
MKRLHLSGAAPPAAATPSGCFVMRTPLLPHDVLAASGDALEATAAADPSRLADALAADRARLRGRLREIVARPEVREAIFLASPGLEASLGVWERDPEGRRGRQIERALYGYVARMAGRPTPFGLFATVSAGAIGDRTELTLDGPASCRRHTRLGIDYLVALADAIDRRREVRERVHVRVNPTLVRAAGRVRFTAAQRTATSRAYRLVAAEVTPYLEATLARAAGGARIADLARALVDDDPEIAVEDAEGYVHELVDAQLLVSSTAPRVTGGEPANDLLDRLREHPELTGVAARLADARDRLAAIDEGGLGAAPDRYREIARVLDGPSAAAAPSLFHVELARGARGLTLGREPVTEILRGVEILRRLARPSRSLRRFVEAFAVRHGDAEVPLLEALDDESGVGFDAPAGGAVAVPLLQGLRISSEEAVAQLTARDALLLRKVEQARCDGQRSLELSLDELLRSGRDDAPPLPVAFHAVARIAAASPQALSRGDFTVLVESVAGPSGANLLGACCRGDDRLLARLSEHLRAEEAVRPGAVFAELVVLPEASTGDLMVRPVLREYEIPILGRSGAPDQRQIPIGDLVVSLDRAERIVVRSLRLGREVIPRMTVPVDATTAEIGVVRFLCALQHQGTASDLAFRWGPLEALAVLPRVQAGRVILARARWRLFADALHGLATPGTARFRAVQRLREELEIPRHVEIGESGRWLPLDLDSALCVDVLGHRARARRDVVLREPFPASDQLCAAGPDGRFVHELVIPFLRDDRTQTASEPVAPPARLARRFLPGSEWLQTDIHTGLGSADRVITALVRPWVADAMIRGAADRWFFLRYAEHGARLRVRVHGDPARLLGEVFPALHSRAAVLVQDGVIWNVALDTYQRETERFGGPHGIEIAEHMFHVDSDAVAAILEHLQGDAGEIARWQLTLRGIDGLLDDLGLDRRAKLEVMRYGKAKLAGMLQASPGLDRELGTAHRRQRASLEALLDPAGDPTGDLAAPLAVLHERSTRLAPWVDELRGRERAGQLTQTLAELAWSFVHMFTNRMLRSASLAQELVLYDWLCRAHRSALARERR